MQPWFETIGVIILALLGITLGLLIGKIKKRLWLLGYLLPLILIVMIALTRNIYQLGFHQPFLWVCAGRREFVIFSFSIPMLFGSLIPRLLEKTEKIMIGFLVAAASISFFVIPFISPILVRKELENLETVFLDNGICIQTTDYTCGPAAAVTALNQFSIIADEGELAILAYTTPQTGTSDDLLVKAIEKKYGPEGIRCEYRYFTSVEQLKGNYPVIAVVKFSFMIDHYITVLEVTNDKVIIGNPSVGKEVLTYDEFKKKWRHVGIVVKK